MRLLGVGLVIGGWLVSLAGLFVSSSPAVRGLIAVQVIDDETLAIELMPGATDVSGFKGFTSAKRTYRR